MRNYKAKTRMVSGVVLNYVSMPFLLMEGSISPPLRTRWDLCWPSPTEGQAQHEQRLGHKRKSCHTATRGREEEEEGRRRGSA